MLGSKCCCTKELPCNTSTQSGGAGITIKKYSMPSYSGDVSFRYEAFSIKDRFTVYNTANEDEIYFDTGEPISGGATITFFKPDGVTSVSVRVEGPSGTAWNYTISCPERRVNCLTSCDDDENGNPYFTNIKSISITLEAEDFEISIPRFGYQYRPVVYSDVPVNRRSNRVGDFYRWYFQSLDSEWWESPVLPGVELIFGIPVLIEPDLEWGGDPIEVVYESKALFPLGMLNGTFDLEYDSENDRYVYDFDECEYECLDSNARGTTKLIFYPSTCELVLVNFKYYVSINAGDVGGCDDTVYNPFFPEPGEFKFKSVYTNTLGLYSWGGGTRFTFPTISCGTNTETGSILEDTIGINQDVYWDVHPFCSVSNFGFSNWFWGACGSFDPDDSNRLGIFADNDEFINLPVSRYGSYRLGIPYEQETVTVNVGKPIIADFVVRDCRWENNGLNFESSVFSYLDSTFLGCAVNLQWKYADPGIIDIGTYIDSNSDILGVTANRFVQDDEEKFPWVAPTPPASWYYLQETEIVPYSGPPIDNPYLENRTVIDGIIYTNRLVITGNKQDNTIITKGKNNLILRRVDVEFDEPQQEL